MSSIEEIIKNRDLEEKEFEYDASKLFTDREEPQEAFERKLSVLSHYRKDISVVMNYYGMGGMGKTSLKNRLAYLLNGEPSIPRKYYKQEQELSSFHVTIDFAQEGLSTASVGILKSLRNQIKQCAPKTKFLYFDLALVKYMKLVGEEPKENKTGSLILEDNPWLGTFVSGLGVFPGIGWLSSFLDAIDKAGGAIKEKVSANGMRRDTFIEELMKKEVADLQKVLPECFVIDMNDNVLNDRINKPLVIFIDTYEKYIDSLNKPLGENTIDRWLRNIIKKSRGIFWVIFGREKLAWAKDDPYWNSLEVDNPLYEMTEEEKDKQSKEHIEYHLLGGLSEADTSAFFEKAGIEDQELHKGLYKLTDGIPLFLDVCVRRYQAVRKTKTPELSDFGSDINDLSERYIGNMPEYYQKMTLFLLTLEKWTHEKVMEIGPRVLDDFSEERYNNYIRHSFVVRDADQICYYHELFGKTVKNVLEKSFPGVRNRTLAELREWVNKELYDLNSQLDLPDRVHQYVKTAFFGLSDDMVDKAYHECLLRIKILSHAGYTIDSIEDMNYLLDFMCSRFPDRKIQYLFEFIENYKEIGQYYLANQLVEGLCVFSESNPDSLFYGFHWYKDIGERALRYGIEYKTAIERGEEVDDYDYISNYSSLERIHGFDKAVDLGNRLLKTDNDLDDISEMELRIDLGDCYLGLGDYPNAIKVLNETRELVLKKDEAEALGLLKIMKWIVSKDDQRINNSLVIKARSEIINDISNMESSEFRKNSKESKEIQFDSIVWQENEDYCCKAMGEYDRIRERIDMAESYSKLGEKEKANNVLDNLFEELKSREDMDNDYYFYAWLSDSYRKAGNEERARKIDRCFGWEKKRP